MNSELVYIPIDVRQKISAMYPKFLSDCYKEAYQELVKEQALRNGRRIAAFRDVVNVRPQFIEMFKHG